MSYKLVHDVIETIFLMKKQLSQIFVDFDTNKNGTINKTEFEKGLQKLMNNCCHPKTIEELWGKCDKNMKGEIDKKTFMDKFELTVKWEKRFVKKFHTCALDFSDFESLKQILIMLYHDAKNDFAAMFMSMDDNNDGFVTKDEFMTGLMNITPPEGFKVEEEDALKLFALIDEGQAQRINLRDFIKLVTIADVNERTKIVPRTITYHVEIDLHFKQPQYIMARYLSVLTRPGQCLRVKDMSADIENLLFKKMSEGRENRMVLIKNTYYNRRAQARPPRGMLELHLVRVVDCVKRVEDKGPAVFCVFSASYESYNHLHFTTYTGRFQFDENEQLTEFDYDRIQSKVDYQVKFEHSKPKWEDWPEYGVNPRAYMEVNVNGKVQAELEKLDDEKGKSRAADLLIKRKFTNLQMAAPAFTVVDLRRVFEALDVKHNGKLTQDEFIRELSNDFMCTYEAEKLTKQFYALMKHSPDTPIHCSEFVDEYVRMQSFKAVQSIIAIFNVKHARRSINKLELQEVLATFMGEEEAADKIDLIFRQCDQDNSGDVSLKEIAVWYFGYQTKLRMRQRLMLYHKREDKEKEKMRGAWS